MPVNLHNLSFGLRFFVSGRRILYIRNCSKNSNEVLGIFDRLLLLRKSVTTEKEFERKLVPSEFGSILLDIVFCSCLVIKKSFIQF